MAVQEKESRKRKPVSNDLVESASDDEEDSDFELGLLDDEVSSDEEDFEDSGDEAESESGENSDDEVEEISRVDKKETVNGKFNGIGGSESEDLLSDASSEFYSSDDGEVVLDADGNPRKLLPEIDPHYDSDSSTYSEINTIGNIDIEKYYPASMPHIGYDINGRRIMRPAAGAALDQLLDTIDLPKGWTGIIDKETGIPKNLTEEELEIIKRIRKEELPNDQTEIYDVPSPSKFDVDSLAISIPCRRSFPSFRRSRT
jgi:ribosome biogenesis protein ERB1